MINPAVAQLSGQSALERLNVIDDRFGFHHESPVRSGDHGVPGPEVAIDRQRNLGPPTKTRIHLASQPFQQPCVAGIADRIAGGIRLQTQVQPDCGRHARLDLKVGDPRLGVEDPPDRRGVHATCTAKLPIAQPAASTGGIDVSKHAPLVLRHPTSCATDASVPNTHRRGVSQRPVHHWLFDGRAAHARRVAPLGPQPVRNSGFGPPIGVAVRPAHGGSPSGGPARRNVHPPHGGSPSGPSGQRNVHPMQSGGVGGGR